MEEERERRTRYAAQDAAIRARQRRRSTHVTSQRSVDSCSIMNRTSTAQSSFSLALIGRVIGVAQCASILESVGVGGGNKLASAAGFDPEALGTMRR